jgi:ABC-type nitrate/sulfonate/bicarbonate transport system substrate-binding protein
MNLTSVLAGGIGAWGRLPLLVALAVLLTGCQTAASPTQASETKGTGVSPDAASQAPATGPAASAPTKPGGAPQTLQKVRLSATGLMAEAPHYIAMEKGYFRDLGIEVEIATIATGGDVMGALSAGQLDVVGGGVNLGTFNAVLRGVPLAVVADQTYLTPGADGDIWMVRSDLVNQIQSVRDLRGRKVAINSTTSPLVYMLGKTLETQGMKMEDVEIVTVPFPDMIAAFENKAIDAGIEVEPFVARAEELGVAKAWMEISQAIGPMEVGVAFFNTDWAKMNHDLAVNYLVAYLRGAHEYYAAMNHGANRTEVIGILTKYLAIKDPALYDSMRWLGINPDGQVDISSVQDQIDWYFRQGYLNERVSAERVVDHSYLDAALKIVGRYRR